MRNFLWISMVLALVFGLAPAAPAHFQVLIPSTDVVTGQGDTKIGLDIIFTHPMEQGPVMEMGKPTQFGVMVGDNKTDLSGALNAVKKDGKTAYTAEYTAKEPGDYIFYIEPAAYWEPAEGVMIIHYTKVVVDAFAAEEGWDQMVGFPVEIEPLTRPYGLWAGNAFRGVVKKDGKPVPFAEIEVEFYNTPGIKPPTALHVTQVIKADGQGVFSYVMPKAGWWSFAALVEGDEKMKNPEGKEVGVELGGLIWVKTYDMK